MRIKALKTNVIFIDRLKEFHPTLFTSPKIHMVPTKCVEILSDHLKKVTSEMHAFRLLIHVYVFLEMENRLLV